MQQAQATMQAAIGMTFPAAQTPPMLAGQASTVPRGSNTVPHAPQTPIMQAQVQNPEVAQGGYQHQPPMYGAMQEENTKTRRFVMGLRGSIHEHVLGLEKKIYNEAAQIARVIELSQKESYFAQNRESKGLMGILITEGTPKYSNPSILKALMLQPRLPPQLHSNKSKSLKE
ncbi:hypothetical protein NE237_008803 [Protea cynaroides]|uniref:Uncharacterized protein n=1 Tax=Protea cynaroides TaxID=273540 RepID=A0A9Q0KW84_9MAGN|nr:hypothetical protein NE237_008803 [Protea cynaroides]